MVKLVMTALLLWGLAGPGQEPPQGQMPPGPGAPGPGLPPEGPPPGPPPEGPPPARVSARLKWTPREADKAFLARLLEADLALLRPQTCTWTPLTASATKGQAQQAMKSILEVHPKRHGQCFEMMKSNPTLSEERDVPKEVPQVVQDLEAACKNLVTDLGTVAAATEGCGPFQVASNAAPDLRAYTTLIKAANVVAKARMTRGDVQGGTDLLLELARFTQVTSSGSVDMQLALANMNAWISSGHDLMRHVLQSVPHQREDLLRLIDKLGILVDSEPSLATTFLGDGVAMQMQVTLPLFFGPRWKPPVGWNPVLHPGGQREQKRPLLSPVGSPQEAMFLYLYTRLKLRSLLPQCRALDSSGCLEVLVRSYREEVEVMLPEDRLQRFRLAYPRWGLLRTLTFLLTVEEQRLRLPNLGAMLLDCHRRVSSLYHLRFHARLLLAQLDGEVISNPDQFRTPEWKPFIYQRHFGQDTAIALVEKQLQLTSQPSGEAGGSPLAGGFRYEIHLDARFPAAAPTGQ